MTNKIEGKYFARIVGHGYDHNRNYLNRVYLYQMICGGSSQGAYDYAPKHAIKAAIAGRYNADGHYVTTQDTREEILNALRTLFESVSYIFE